MAVIDDAPPSVAGLGACLNTYRTLWLAGVLGVAQ